MKTLEQEITVSVDDLDDLNHVNNVSVCSLGTRHCKRALE